MEPAAASERRPLTRYQDDWDGSCSELEAPDDWAADRPRRWQPTWRDGAKAATVLGAGLALLALVAAGSSSTRAYLAARVPATQQMQQLVGDNASVQILHLSQDCWEPCGNVSGNCPGFCGAGNACCRYSARHDPPECWGIASWPTKEFHTCAVPLVPTVVAHEGQECLKHCGSSGSCAWCGQGNACCRAGLNDRVSCSGVRYWPVLHHHTCVRPNLLPPGPALPPAPSLGPCLPGDVQDPATGKCTASPVPTVMRFYMYKALGDQDYHMENSNLASITAVLMYLQNEVLSSCPRRFGITRVMRYLVTMKNTASLFRPPAHSQFGEFVQFKNGKCVTNNSLCSPLWEAHGYVVGCTNLDTSHPNTANYSGPPAPVLYSLPGKCPSMEFGNKTQECIASQPGGQCSSPDGDIDCTWKAEPAGEVRVDEIANIVDYGLFCRNGGVEYDPTTDKGNGMTFWNGRRDAVACRQRVARVQQLFQLKYPYYPATLGVPRCDAGR